MKAFLIAGAVLMTGASIYGFIDYEKTSRDKAFTKMYKPEEPLKVETKQAALEKKTALTNASVKTVKTEPVTAVTITSKPAKKKKVSYKLFSRAALEEKYINKEEKKEVKKDN